MIKIDFDELAKRLSHDLEFTLDAKGPMTNLILPAEEEAKRWQQWRDRRMTAINEAEARYQARLKNAYKAEEIDGMELAKHSTSGIFSPFERMRQRTRQTYAENAKSVF